MAHSHAAQEAEHSMEFKDKYGSWGVVAGASEGLGAAFARGLAERGLNVVILARRSDALQQVAEGIRSDFGVEVRAITADMSDPDVTAKIAVQTNDLEIGFFIYNAAAEPAGLFLDEKPEVLTRNIVVNCITPSLLTHHFANLMKPRGRGGVCLVSSAAGLQGIKVFVAYGAAKAYELILAEGLWDEFRDIGLDAMALVVGSTATPEFVRRSPVELTPEVMAERGIITPEQAAKNFFEAFGTGPRRYSYPEGEDQWIQSGGVPRADLVTAIGQMTSATWSGTDDITH